MNKTELIAALESGREQLDVVLAQLGPEEMAQKEMWPGWTVKDVLAHLAAWEAELVLALVKIRQGQPPRYATIANAEIDTLNQRWHAENRDRPLERVLADFHGVRKQTLRQIEEFSDADLTRPGRYDWLGDATLANWIADYSQVHEAEHRVGIEAWLHST